MAQDKQIFVPALATQYLLVAVRAAMAEINKMLKCVIKRANAPDTFENWLKEKKLFTPMDVALLSPDEKCIDEKILKVCKDAIATAGTVDPQVEVSIRKVWWYCRESMKHPAQEERKVLEPEEMSDLDTCWANAGGIKLSTKERVTKSLLKKMYSMVISDPIEYEITPLEGITVMSTVS